jgi:outer membrane lipoprotein-sorting protein
VFSRRWLLFSIHLGALLYVSLAPAFAQDEPKTAEEVINRYLSAVGADRFSSIKTFEERGELYGNFVQGQRSPGQFQNKKHGTFEFYFKSPNLRYSSTLSGNDVVLALHGCDGKVSWYIDPFLKRSEFKPKPGSERDCEKGFEPSPLGTHRANLKMRLPKKKEIEGHMVWEVKVEDPKSPWTEHYYFDADTFLLFGSSRTGLTITYSDYRDVAGIKIPFTTVNYYNNSKLVSTIRELKINAPIDDARFVEPQPKNGMVPTNSGASAPTNSPDKALVTAPAPETSSMGVSVSNDKSATAVTADLAKPALTVAAPTNTAGVTEVNFPNFTSCSVAELQLAVPDLKGLKPAPDQEELAGLLDKVGAKTIDTARNTPNLISDESVTESVKGLPDIHHDYDYLIVTRIRGKVVDLNEFRVDVKTGDKFQTDALMKDDSTTWTELERASQNLTSSRSGGPPSSQGFATSWVHFYPLNRGQATFRYLGAQKVNGHHTLVLAFAQKPESVISPAIFRSQGKVVPMFLQGVAWVDPSDFRILRLRTDLLSPLPEVSLHRLTADIQFVATKIDEVPSLLWLPRDVMVTSECGGSTLHEIHKYSKYRLFRARSRIVLNPGN